MDVHIDIDSEVWHEYKEKTLENLRDMGFVSGKLVYDSDEERAMILQEVKNAVSGAAMKSARMVAESNEETLFLLCGMSVDMAITALALLDQMAFKHSLRDM
ncbi:MAG: hypothetical protein IJG82_09360 [Atopobiaceae bacterium]|nr:hypothetical protein [Atopobiaceae bacterium]